MDRDRERYTAEREADGQSRYEPDHETVPVREREPRVVREDELDVAQRTEVRVGRDRIRWGPIWAGLLVALASFLLLSVLALAIGALTVEAIGSAGTVAAVTGWATAIIGLIAFFVGGYVAGATSVVRGTVAGLLNGLLVWALGIVLILMFSALGVGQVFGALGSLFSQFRALVIIPEGSAQVVRQAADAIASGAFAAFLSMLLPAIAAVGGGWLGAKTAPREGDGSGNAQTARQR